jgi:hypothetical protein
MNILSSKGQVIYYILWIGDQFYNLLIINKFYKILERFCDFQSIVAVC